uniref:CLOCK-interacting pacemaker b n=1 Tax=Fundulus heteroclitus TaxID=8078 RepID=A0A3Q2PU23_FUNHE
MSAKRKAESLLRAANRPYVMKCRGSLADSERDSGFSDASSEHLSTMDATDSEDSPQPAARRGAQGAGSDSKRSQPAVVGGSYSRLSPMIIMNNVVLKQPVENPPALKPWGFSPTVEVVQPVVPPPQVVFLQPVVSRQGSKEATSKHRRSRKYLPILKSYPKIAPHPGDGVGSSGRGTASSSSSSSSSSSGSEKCSTLSSSLWEQHQRQKEQRSLCSSTSNSACASPSLPGTPSTASPLLHTRLSLPAAEGGAGVSPATEGPSPDGSPPPPLSPSKHQTLSLDSISSLECGLSDGGSDSKRKRFCNTYNILSKSGLLDITLRTKELLRQNQSTQSDLDRLRKHTDLFLLALQTGDTSGCVKLLSSLQEEDRERAAQNGLKADQT